MENTTQYHSRGALVSVDVEKAKCSTTMTVSVDLNMQLVYQVSYEHYRHSKQKAMCNRVKKSALHL